MKNEKRILALILTVASGLILMTCQKELPLDENQLIFSTDTRGIDSMEIISGPVASYLLNTGGLINNMYWEGQINKGNANSLNVKIQNAVKSFAKLNTEAFEGQLNSFVNEIKAYVENRILTSENGEMLIGRIETVFIAVEGQFTDPQDGYTYPVVLLGDQLWMAENLRTTKYSDGTEIPLVTLPDNWAATTTGAYCWFANNFDRFGSVYGAMYNWFAVNTGNLCPAGWHVPDTREWSVLTDFLVEGGYGYGGSGIGIAKAMAATSEWGLSLIEGTPGNDMETNNSSGFNALPGGQRGNTGFFYNPYNLGNWWTASVMIPDVASYGRNITLNSQTVRIAGYANKMGMYVRCVR